MTQKWDVFISHASEDKESFVRPLAIALRRLDVSVWYDEFSLRVGDSISGAIDKGLAEAAYGLVVISRAFIEKPGPKRELRGRVTREVGGRKVILPIWHGLTHREVMKFSPPLADALAIDTAKVSPQDAAIQILQVVRPDLYNGHPRSQLEKLATGEAITDLQREVERARAEQEALREELSEYQCPYCEAPLAIRVDAPVDEEQKHWDMREAYECGYQCFGGSMERPCPADPKSPKFEDYELRFTEDPEEPKWCCHAVPKTYMARLLWLSSGYGATRKEAERSVRDQYNACARRARKQPGNGGTQ